MKRSESFLVYGVTALLVIILVVAVVFGNETQPYAPGGSGGGVDADARKLASGDEAAGAVELADLVGADLVGADPARLLEGLEGGDQAQPWPAGAGPAGAGSAEAALSEAGSAASGLAALGMESVGTDSGAHGSGGSGLAASAASAGAPAEQPVPAVLQPLATGPAAGAPAFNRALSRRVGDYRQVTVRPGDTFSALVQRWCGSLDHLPLAEALNEEVDMDRLPSGHVLLLPWIDDDLVRAARKESLVVSTKLDAATGQTYTLKSGDSLWKIAVQKTGGQHSAPAYIERVMELNPGLVPERLHVGQQIVLPQ